MSFKSLTSLAAVCVSMLPSLAHAQTDWKPSKPIRLIVPVAPGGSLDLVTRVTAEHLTAELGQQVVVDNKPGANGVVAIPAAISSEPDGHTILMVTTTMVAVNPALYENLPYDAVRDFAPLGTVSDTPMVMIATPSFGANNVQELISLAKSKPGSMFYASSSTGAFSHLTMEMLKQRAGMNLVHVPHKGEAAALQEIAAGRVPVAFLTLSTCRPLIDSGKVKALGMLTPQRLPELPNIPTVAEQGLPGFAPSLWYGLVAPKATPPHIVAAFNRAINNALAKPALKELFARQSLTPLPGTTEEFAARIRGDIPVYAEIVKSAAISVK